MPVRLGCGGCLGTLLLVTVLLGAVAGTAWGTFRALAPASLVVSPGTQVDGLRAQQKLYGLVRQAGSGKPHRETVTLSEPELNAFLARHLDDAAGIPLSGIGIRLVGGGVIEFSGRTALGNVLTEWPVSGLRHIVPTTWLERPVWVGLRARVRLEPPLAGQRRYVRLDPERWTLGQQPLPVVLLRQMLDPATLAVLRWPAPPGIEAIVVDPGRLVIRTAA